MNFPLNECVFVDIETTGLDRAKDDIIEIAALKVKEGEVTGWFSSLIHRESLPDNIATLTGITADDLKACPSSPEKVISAFRDFVGDLPMVGHNIIEFDSEFISRYYETYLGESLDNTLADTLLSSYYSDVFKGASNHRLSTLAGIAGADVSNAHRALADCRMTLAVAKAMWGEGETETVPYREGWYQEMKKAS